MATEARLLLTGPGSSCTGSWRLNGGNRHAIAAESLGTSDLTICFGGFDYNYNVNLPGYELRIIGGDFVLCMDQPLVFKAMRGWSPDDESTELFALSDGDYDVNVLVGDVGFGEDQVKCDSILVVVGDAGDTDNDGLLDSCETENLANLSETGDGDGAEFSAGALPNKADTDEDGLNDGDEVNVHGTNPSRADTVLDGLTEKQEVSGAAPSNPLLADSDGDGRSDQEEVSGDPTSDPMLADTNGDGSKWHKMPILMMLRASRRTALASQPKSGPLSRRLIPLVPLAEISTCATPLFASLWILKVR